MSHITAAAAAPALLHDIDWRTYSRLLRAFDTRRRFRLTYDRGTLEIMPPLFAHEGPARFLGRLIIALTEELGLAVREGGSVTLRRRRRRRGLEADCCYWIANAALLDGKHELDLNVDPPPDLAVEVDVTSSSLDRMSIYAALLVPEVWRLTSDAFTFNVLEKGAYRVRTNSLAFPQLVSADLLPFLVQHGLTNDNALVIQFRAWVRQQGTPPAP